MIELLRGKLSRDWWYRCFLSNFLSTKPQKLNFGGYLLQKDLQATIPNVITY